MVAQDIQLQDINLALLIHDLSALVVCQHKGTPGWIFDQAYHSMIKILQSIKILYHKPS